MPLPEFYMKWGYMFFMDTFYLLIYVKHHALKYLQLGEKKYKSSYHLNRYLSVMWEGREEDSSKVTVTTKSHGAGNALAESKCGLVGSFHFGKEVRRLLPTPK